MEQPPYSDEVLRADVERVRRLARSMDTQFEIAGIKLGWDAIIGLVPVAGDFVSAAIGLYPIVIARKHGLGNALQTRMAMNLLIDWAVGEVPLLGDAFDVFFRANVKNAALLEREIEKRLGRSS